MKIIIPQASVEYEMVSDKSEWNNYLYHISSNPERSDISSIIQLRNSWHNAFAY